MAEFVEAEYHQGKRRIEGVVPRNIFMPMPKPQGFCFTYGLMDGTKALWDIAQRYLGINRYRLWIVLGGESSNSHIAGHSSRLSQLFMSRLAFLFYLKGSQYLNTGAIYAIDWKKGVIYLNEGQPLTFVPPKRSKLLEEQREREQVAD